VVEEEKRGKEEGRKRNQILRYKVSVCQLTIKEGRRKEKRLTNIQEKHGTKKGVIDRSIFVQLMVFNILLLLEERGEVQIQSDVLERNVWGPRILSFLGGGGIEAAKSLTCRLCRGEAVFDIRQRFPQ